ncbi:MAG: Membrane protein insertase YidC [Parcubacteria group bacterium ADurb.Bin115]|nr:MAG: Membrane protein insertase YidC [Parcubacteria group bacterium ADurb.Bin115]HOD86990.1 YidC/Oxa1 family membrane protein insertase [bacterium]
MNHLFQIIFYQPILNLLVLLYNSVSMQDLGLSIILLTVIIKLILWPLSKKSIKSQKSLQELQPKIDELKLKYKDNQAEMGKALMSLYKEHQVNPFSSCLPILLQLPFFIAVYRVFRDGLGQHLDLVYPFIYRPEFINSVFLGFLDLSKPNIYLAILAGLAQFWQAKMMMTKRNKNKTAPSVNVKDEGMAAIMNKQMLYFMPALTIFIGITLPGGLTLYWLVLTLLTVLQQFLMNRKTHDEVKIIEGEIVKQ